MPADKLVLLTGTTGYGGGQWFPLLVENGWRVESIEPGKRLRSATETKLPGRAVAGPLSDAGIAGEQGLSRNVAGIQGCCGHTVDGVPREGNPRAFSQVFSSFFHVLGVPLSFNC